MSQFDEHDNNQNGGYEEFCFICRRPESVTGKMFHLPGGMCVCDDCMHKTMDSMEQMGYMNPSGIDLKSLFEVSPSPMNFADYDKWVRTQFPKADRGQETSGETNTSAGADMGEDSHKPGEAPEGGSEETEKRSEAVAGPGEDGAKRSSSAYPKYEEEDPQKHEEEERPTSPRRPGGFPNISFLSMADLQNLAGGFGPQQKVKKKKPGTPSTPPLALKDIPAPHKIKAQLDEYVIGQEHAKKVISVAVYNHYKRVATGTMDNIEIEKSNMLMIGPTGCGKTYLVKTLARLLNVPLAIADATSLTEAGYIGDDIESVISKLLAAADNDVERAESGIVFIDEIDKIAKKKNTTSRDVSGESVQQGLLKLLEGAEVEVPVGAGSKNAMVPMVTVNTRNILFICGGAFPGLEEVIKQRLSKQTGIGYNAELKDRFDKEKNILGKVTVEDIRKFGMIPEFIGRLPVIYTLESLTKEALIRILKEPKNAILKQYEKLLELDEVKLVFAEEALEAIAEKALEKETGARALRSIIEEFMLDIMYEIPKDDNIGTVTITADYVNGTGGPIIDIRSESAVPMEQLKEIDDEQYLDEADPEESDIDHLEEE